MSALAIFLTFVSVAQAQSVSARISVLSTTPPRVKLQGTLSAGTANWSFRNQYATVSNLGERIENFSLSDSRGAPVAVRQIAPGEYRADSPAIHFTYDLKLEPPTRTSDSAYVSWLTNERGLLLLGDLLPRQAHGPDASSNGVRLSFSLPATWKAVANEPQQADGQFQVANAEQAVFLVGPELRQRRERLGRMGFASVTSGQWAFTDDEVLSTASSILKEHAGVMGGQSRSSAMLILIPFPRSVGAGQWSAETRGGTITLLSGQAPSRTAALAQLSVPLTHELFHLWVPNGLALDGNYDWFYEGFTSYQAMRAAMRLQLLTFQDYLNAISRSFDAYIAIGERDQLSLVEASRQRWRSLIGLVYHKGLLVAFLYDLTLRLHTKNEQSLDTVYRELFRLHSSASRTDGNRATINLLKKQGGMQEFVQQYIENARDIDLRTVIVPFGLELARGGVRTHLTAANLLSRPQRDLLRKIGYNEEAQRRR